MTAVVGATGSGKSTLFGLLSRLYECPAASILLDGRDIRSFSLESLHAHMAVVSQDTWLFHDSIRKNLCHGLEQPPSDDRLWAVLEEARLGDVVRRLPKGLDAELGDRGVTLSGGEKQRLTIARALLRESDILLLDEATSALDIQTELEVQAAIRRAYSGRTLIVAAHRFSALADADWVIVIEQGCVVAEGTWPTVLALHEPTRRYMPVELQEDLARSSHAHSSVTSVD